MKRKAIVLLIASMVLTFGSVGTVFAEEPVTQTSQKTVHEHSWGSSYYVVDKEAKYEWVNVVDSPEHTVAGAQLYTKQPDGTWLGNGEIYWFENGFTTDDLKEIIADKISKEGYPGNYVNIEKTVPAVTHEEYQEVSPEEGHNEYKCTVCGEIQNSDTGEVIKPGTLTNTQTTPSEPSTTDEQNDPNGSTKPSDSNDNQNIVQNTESTETKEQDSNKTTETTNSKASDAIETKENKAPQTGDTASLISLVTLAGSVLTGGTAIGFKRKFKR